MSPLAPELAFFLWTNAQPVNYQQLGQMTTTAPAPYVHVGAVLDSSPSPKTFERRTANPQSWLARAHAELRKLATLPSNWDDASASPPNALAMISATSIVDMMRDLDLEPSRILPSVEEGVAISFGKDDKYAVIEAYNDGALAVALISDTMDVQSREFADEPREIREVLETIAQHIA